MYYVCLENNSIVSILNYSPNVPSSVTVHEITDAQANQIKEQTHYFDVPSKTVKLVDASITAQKAKDLANGLEREFLNNTDWKVLRHLRQKALNIPTTLTEAEYLKLEQERNEAAARIV
jgi:hypothetical protein